MRVFRNLIVATWMAGCCASGVAVTSARAEDASMSDYLHAGYKIVGVASNGASQVIFALQKDGGYTGNTIAAVCIYDKNLSPNFCKTLASSN